MRSVITIFALLFATASQAASVNINFDGATVAGPNVTEVPQGFEFTAASGLISGTNQTTPFCPVTPGPQAVGNNIYCAIGLIVGRSIVNFERIDGSMFDLLALDAFLVPTDCGFGDPCRSDDAIVSAWNSSNQLVATKTIRYSELGTVTSTINFDASWTGISRVTYAAQQELGSEAGSYVYLDNISVNVVPIPPAVWLLGSALAGLGWLRRKHTV